MDGRILTKRGADMEQSVGIESAITASEAPQLLPSSPNILIDERPY